MLNNNYYFSKKIHLYFICLLMIFVTCLVQSTKVKAEVKIKEPKKTIYLESYDIGTPEAECHLDIYFTIVLGEDVIGKPRTDNEHVTGNFYIFSEETDYEDDDGLEHIETNFFCMKPRYPGTANILFEDGSGKAYSVTAEVLPYENPIKSLKITNINNGKDLSKKLDKAKYYKKKLIFSKETSAPKLKVKAANDWQITALLIHTENKEGKMRYDKDILNLNTKSKTVNLKKAFKDDNIEVILYLKNTKNDAVTRAVFSKLYY